nr:hypothetical protein [Hepelivirales sp.]
MPPKSKNPKKPMQNKPRVKPHFCVKCGRPATPKLQLCRPCFRKMQTNNSRPNNARPQSGNGYNRPQRPIKQQQNAPTRQMQALSMATKSLNPTMDVGITRAQPRSALTRAVLTVVSPTSVQGQRAVRAHIDEVAIAKMPFQYNTVFTVLDNSPSRNADVKIQWLPSAVVVCRLWSSAGPASLSVGLTGSIVTDKYVYVLNSNLGFVGTISEQTLFTAKPDWRKFRVLATSGSITWSGQQLQKNGTVTVARAEDSDELETFVPSSKSDFVTLNLADGVVSTCAQHDEPTYPFHSVDPNDKYLEGDNTQYVEATTLLASQMGSVAGTFGTAQINSGTTTWATFTSDVDSVLTLGDANANAKILATLNNLNSKWSVLVGSTSGLSYTGSVTWNLSFFNPLDGQVIALTGNWSIWYEEMLNTTYNGQSLSPGNISLVTAIWDAVKMNIASRMATAFITPPAFAGTDAAVLGLLLNLTFRATPGKAIRGRDIDESIHPTIDLRNPDLFADAAQFFFDPTYQPPVAHVVATDLQLTCTHVSMVELVVSDNTPFTANTIAQNDSSDRQAGMSKADFVRFNRIVKSMPPATQSGTAAAQLQSRGILQDVVSVIGGVASAIFPEAAPFVKPAVNIAGFLENL